MTVQELAEVMRVLRIDRLIDCRSVPQSRRPGFGKQQLARTFCARYEWHGDTLGGRGAGVTSRGLKFLSTTASSSRLLLLCKEEAPGDCHRHTDIAVPLLRAYQIDCHHVYQTQLIKASELQAAIERNDDNYAFTAWA